MSAPTADCAGHTGLAGDVREMAAAALDRLEPWLDQLRQRVAVPATAQGASADDAADPIPASCAVCPICAVIALLRGERAELAVRWADQAAGLLTVLRTALNEGAPTPAEPGAEQPGGEARAGPEAGGQRSVQHIPVHRADAAPHSGTGPPSSGGW